MSLEDFFANPDSAENQNEISVQPDVDAQTSEQDRIPRSLSDTHERRFGANLVRYYDEETAKIIMETRAQMLYACQSSNSSHHQRQARQLYKDHKIYQSPELSRMP